MTEMSTEQNDRLVNDLKVVISDAEELLRNTAGDVSTTASELRVRMQARLQQAKANLGQLQEATVARAKAAGVAADDYVHDNPWRAIGAAAGVGLVIGLLIGRR